MQFKSVCGKNATESRDVAFLQQKNVGRRVFPAMHTGVAGKARHLKLESHFSISISIPVHTSRSMCSRSQHSRVHLRVDFAASYLELSSELYSKQPELTDTAGELSSNLLF